MVKKILLGATIALFVLSAQQPTCDKCSASYISSGEVKSYLKRAKDNGLVDQQTRAVSIGKANIGIGAVYRGKLAAPMPNSVAEHDLVSEVYHVIDGSATLVTGPDIVDMKRRPADLQTVREFNGPGNSGSSIRNGVTHQLKAGDVIVIPAGTGHWFTKIDDHIRYIMVRIDPEKVLPLKDEAASQAYLKSPVTNGKAKGK
jgi:mannose-6-phosphate isomerase-like protein (cupin superfamily)